MPSMIESLSGEGISASEFNMWLYIRNEEEACDWIDPDPRVQMVFTVASDAQIVVARERLRLTIQLACDSFGLILDYPQVEPGQPIPTAPNGQKYYGDWYKGIKNAVVRVNRRPTKNSP